MSGHPLRGRFSGGTTPPDGEDPGDTSPAANPLGPGFERSVDVAPESEDELAGDALVLEEEQALDPVAPGVDADYDETEDRDTLAVEDTGYREPAAYDAQWEVDPDGDSPATPGARKLLAGLLVLLGLGWLGFAGWSAGRALAGEGLDAPDLALWIAAACAPLILLALLWTIFGRTRRREAEAFQSAVARMRAEADALDQRLYSMSRNLGENRRRLADMAGELEGRADQAADRLRNATSELEAEAGRIAQHGSSLDKTTSAARADMAKLLAQIPEAQDKVGTMAQRLQESGKQLVDHGDRLEQAVSRIDDRVGETERKLVTATEALRSQLLSLDEASAGTLDTVEEARSGTEAAVEALLERTAGAFEQVRSGLDEQAEAVDALMAQARSGIDEAGGAAAAQLSARLHEANGALGGLGERIAQQDEQARLMIANLDTSIGAIEERFEQLGQDGDRRAQTIGASLQAVREQLAATLAESREQDGILESLSSRTDGMRETLNALSHFLNQQLAGDVGGAQDAMERLRSTGGDIGPRMDEIRQQAEQAEGRLDATASRLEQSRETLAQLVGEVDGGIGKSEQRVAELQEAIGALQSDARGLTAETAPALVEAMVQVREAAERARENVREAIARAIPESVGNLSSEASAAVRKAVEDAVLGQMRELDRLSAQAMESARGASDRLSAQMMSIGQTASALESHLAEVEEAGKEGQSEAFAAQVSLLMESMNSAAIDVEKILSNEVDDKSWAAYLKGERGVFTRKAVRLLSSGEAREIGNVYDEDPEFRNATNRFVHDFEAMLRRVLSERDGAIIGITLMSSDMGKLYAALAQVVERRGSR